MIIRILGEGQWRLSDEAITELNEFDDRIEKAVNEEDQDGLRSALLGLATQVRSTGELLADDELHDSDLIVPSSESTLDEIRELLSGGNTDGLIPG
ncbi:PspA-associated protein PspAA [Enemella sp. A6]|uniref:PspA-associated protein PspAA n=1 Tax=Enemella sp. A6 TaxID=3440152 RepID=UPI003EB916D2